MLYELRTYTLKPGSLGDMVKAAATVATEIRKNDYGKLEGYWSTEIGAPRRASDPQQIKVFASHSAACAFTSAETWRMARAS